MVNLPVSIATALGVSVLPRISSALAEGNEALSHRYINKIIEMNAIVVFPAVVGMIICANDIMYVLFPALDDFHIVAVHLLQYGGIAAIFYSFATISTSIPQGNDRFRVPVIHSAIALVIHVVLVVVLLQQTNWNIYVMILGNIVFPLIILALNWHSVIMLPGAKINLKQTILKPLLATMFMGVVLVIITIALHQVYTTSLFNLVLKVVVGGGAYWLILRHALQSMR